MSKKRFFTIIELVTASTLMLILFMMISIVFKSVTEVSSTMNDKISEGIAASKFFNKIADDLEASFPVFYTGEESDGNYVKLSEPSGGNPLGPILPTGNTTGGNFTSGSIVYNGVNHKEFLRCVTTNQLNGGLLNASGFEALTYNDNIDQTDKVVRFATYNYTGVAEVLGGHPPRSVYRRDFPLRPDLRKKDSTLRGGYSVGSFVNIGLPSDGETTGSINADGDINEELLLEGIWEIRTDFLETIRDSGNSNLGEKVLVRVTIEFAITDPAKPYSDPTRYSQYPNADVNPVNGKIDRLEHTYTTVIVVNRSNWDRN